MRAKLLAWYANNARDLPWRHTRDPYAIWVSEIMLQQTRVETVIPYYEKFLQRFPTTHALAEAPEDDVLSMWSGLGYYRRARLLHQGVKEVVASYGGHVPESASARKSLPGVGRYTAGALGSIAFGKQEPVVDGNVSRLLCRLFNIEEEPGRSATQSKLWRLAETIVQGDNPGDLNQALMELGATVCTSRKPKCPDCPLQSDCKAFKRGDPERLPVARKRKQPVEVRAAAVVATVGRSNTDRRVWLVKGDADLFGGLWSVPLLEVESPATMIAARQALRSAGAQGRLSSTPIGAVEHTLTHRHYMVTVFMATAAHGEATSCRKLWPLRSLHRLGVSRLTEKILATALV